VSSGVEVIVLAPLLLSALAQLAGGLAAGAAAGVAGQQLYTAGKAAADMLAAMREQHQAALAELAERQRDELAGARERAGEEAGAAAQAKALAAQTMRRAGGGARQMLNAGLERMEERVGGFEPRPPDLARAVAEMRTMLLDPACNLEQALAQYEALAARVGQAALLQAAARVQAGPAADEAGARLAALLAGLRVSLDSPWFSGVEAEPVRMALEQRLGEVEALGKAQLRLAENLAHQLRTRINTALDELTAKAKAQAARAERLRGQTGELLALLAVLEGGALPEEERRQAAALRGRLATALAEADDADLEHVVDALLAEAQAQYAALEKKLAAQVAQAVVGHELVDVLAGLGYAVEMLEPLQAGGTQHFHVALSAEAGVDLKLSAGGLIQSELVAYAPLDEDATQQSEKLVCGVIDEVVKELGERKLEVRERFRTHYAKGERPRVVARREQRRASSERVAPRKRELPGGEE
jgi:hypothetical protein